MSEMVERAMIHRRGFITGLISLIAAPAIALADTIDDILGASNDSEFAHDIVFRNQLFDFRGKDQFKIFGNCNFNCCTFLVDEKTRYLGMYQCEFRDCSGTHTLMAIDENAHCWFRDCYLWIDDGIGNGHCGEPIS